MKFDFRFASVLKLRRHQEKSEKQKLSKLFRKKEKLKEDYDELQQQSRQHSGAEVKSLQSIVTVRQQYAQKHARQKEMSELKQQLVQLDIAVEQQRWKLAEANKETRKLEKLEQNEKQAFTKAAEHEEQLQQNEIAVQRFNQN